MNPAVIQNWLTFFAVMVALSSPALYIYFSSIKITRTISLVLMDNLSRFIHDLERIKTRDNNPTIKPRGMLEFNITSFAEIKGYFYLYSDLILKNIKYFRLDLYPHTNNFFKHYRNNIETIEQRFGRKELSSSYFGLDSTNVLLNYARESLEEIKRRVPMHWYRDKNEQFKPSLSEAVLFVLMIIFAPIVFFTKGSSSWTGIFIFICALWAFMRTTRKDMKAAGSIFGAIATIIVALLAYAITNIDKVRDFINIFPIK